MNRKMVFAPLLALVLAIGLFPGMALADDTDISTCEFKFVNKGEGTWALYYVKGKTAGVTPKVALYDNGTKVSADKYTVSYKLSWWSGDTEKKKAAKAPLKPKSPEGGSAADYDVIIKAKSGSGYTGTYKIDGQFYPTACVCDMYGLDNQFADPHLAKCPEKLHFAINPMNRYYYVVPQKKAKAILGSLEVRTGGENSMEHPHDGKLVPSKYVKVVYYTCSKDVVVKPMKKGKKLSKQPTTAGTYVMVVKGTGKYYGAKEIVFDIQDKMSNVDVAKIKDVKYTGKTVKPKIKATYAGKTLKAGKDYKVAYKNAKGKAVAAKDLKKAGTYTAVIKGCNPIKTNVEGKIVTKKQDRYFTGTKNVKFKIAK